MLTKEAAQQQVAQMTNTELETLADQVTGRHDDQDTLATQAALERGRRREADETAAQLAAPALAAERAARLVYDGLGLPADGFKAWYEGRLRDEATDQLNRQRNHAAFIYSQRF